jgi:cobalt-zinc-cadmium efflux system protein
MVLVQQCECPETPINLSLQKTRLLWMAVALLAGFFVAEWSVGLWSHSLSLQADAGHILSDVGALGISLIASWIAQQPATGKATFGNGRVEIVAALANGLTLVAIASLIIWQAIHRFHAPETILGLPMLAIAVLGLIVNLLNIQLLHSHSHNDLNLRGALLHVIADTASSVGVIVAALVIHLWDWLWADAAISLLVAVLTAISALPLIQQSLKVLLEYAPESIDLSKVEKSLQYFPGVCQVDKLHIWTITNKQVLLCANITVDCAIGERDRLLQKLQAHLQNNFGITETTLQLTSRPAPPLHPLLNHNLISLITRAN